MKQRGIVFGKLYVYCVKVYRDEGEAVWHAVWRVIYLLCESTQR